MLDDIRFEEIEIAAWLHDVGKFAQRAGEQKYFDKNKEGQYGKLQKGGWYSHTHAVFTAGFLESVKNIFPDNVRPEIVIRLAAAHHNPSNYYEWVIAEGDRLSSGSDRCNNLEELENEHNRKFYEKPMIQILSTVQLDSRKSSTRAYCRMLPLEDDRLLPTNDSKIDEKNYKSLWDFFEQDFLKLQGLKFDSFMKSLDSLLQRYWWCIPSSTINDADISLYQHSKTTAAFACALFRYHENTNTQQEDALRKLKEKKFLFVNGDISGIQKYIFDIKTTKDNAKLLRAKSFQLWSLSQILSEYIVKQFNLSSANIVMSAGGKFIILLPVTTKDLLPQIKLEIEEYFLTEFAGKLSFILSSGVEASSEDVMQKNINNLMNEVSYDSDCCKQKKMQFALQKDGAVLDQLYEQLQKNGQCECCSILPAQENSNLCRNCEVLTEIGVNLTKASVVTLNSDKLLHFGQMVKISKANDNVYGAYVNDYTPGFPLMYLPYTAPINVKENRLKTFEEIATESNGTQKIAMFKADVDNLGLIFSSSLGERMSFSRYAELSSTLHCFFSSYYTWFVKNNNDYNEKIYTVYSGGDDLCIVGEWETVLKFASEFRKQIAQLTNNNPSLTLSAGISLFSPNVPVRMMAESAENALDNSKSYAVNGSIVKDSVTVFDTTVDWNEYDNCLKDGAKIYDCLTSGTLTTGVVYKMIDFANRAKRAEKGNVRDLLWISNFRYMAVRNIKDNTVKEWFLKFGTPEQIQKSRIAVSYALYKQRNN